MAVRGLAFNLACFAVHTHAQSTPPTSSPMTRLVFAQDVDYPPYAYKDPNGTLMGFGKDMADGMSALCADLQIDVVETQWANCWSSVGGGRLGTHLDNGTFDACMTFTHTQGIRNNFAEFSNGILEINKPAGLLTLLVNGQPKVSGMDDLAGKKIVDVGGWAPTADTIAYVTNKCTNQLYSTNYQMLVGAADPPQNPNANDVAMTMLRDGRADAMFVYADQAYNYKCTAGQQTTWNCSLWAGFGTEYAYVQTGQFGYAINGTTLALAKKGSGVAARVDPCLARFMETQAYYNLCVKHNLVSSCYRNQFFPATTTVKGAYMNPTNEQTDCSTGYCPCSLPTTSPSTSPSTGMPSMGPTTSPPTTGMPTTSSPMTNAPLPPMTGAPASRTPTTSAMGRNAVNGMGIEEEDDAIPDWGIAMIVLLCVIILLLFALIVMMLNAMKAKKKGAAQREGQNREMSRAPPHPFPYDSPPPAQARGPSAKQMAPQSYEGDYTYASDSRPAFMPGNRVEALYDGVYHPGTIADQQPDGHYTVNWDDGTHSEAVPPESIRFRDPKYVD